MPRSAPPHISGPVEFAAHFGDSRETLARLATYEHLLRQWQKVVNLVAPSTLDEVWHRHFADSAQLLRLVPPAANRFVDLGSGAGFPGLVLAILLAERNSAARVTLIEGDQRKAAFLREAARATSTTVDILCARIQSASTQLESACVDVVTARALAPLDTLLRLALPFLGPGTLGIFPKGREAVREVEQAQTSWEFDCELAESLTDADARIVVVRGLRPKQEGLARE
jgi:16S rRNA (guanine527-N7)-methyltransferase